MTAGVQANAEQIDTDITLLAIRMRALMTQAKQLNTQVNGQGNGTTYLQGIGHPDPAAALNFISLLNNLSGVYFGTATVASAFNFDNGLGPTWAGRLGDTP